MGLIDTLSSGFKVAQRRPWLLLLPVLLDLWFWLGPRWSVQPLIDSLLRLWTPQTLPPSLLELADSYRAGLETAGAHYNLWWLLDNNPGWLRTVLPALMDPAHPATAPRLIALDTPWLLLGALALLLLAVVLGSLFLVAAARAVYSVTTLPDDGPVASYPRGFWLRRWLHTSLRALALLLLLLVMGAAGSMALSLLLTPVLLISPQGGAGLLSLLALLFGWLLLMAYILFYFTLPALVTDGIGLRQALWRSFNVVSHNFWSTVGLLALTTLILWGFDLIWQRLAGFGAAGVAAAIAGNALLVAGFAAARLIFYQQRSAQWLQSLPTEAGNAG